MRILAVGDIVGSSGIRKLKKELSGIIEKEKIDFVIVNGENSAEGMGITENNFRDIISETSKLYKRSCRKRLQYL